MLKRKRGRPSKIIGTLYMCPKCKNMIEMLVSIKSGICTKCKTKLTKWTKK